MPKIASRLVTAAALASAATIGVASAASAATVGTHVSPHLTMSTTSKAATPHTIRPNLGSCGYDPISDFFTCQILTTSWIIVTCADGAQAFGQFPPGLYEIPSPCDFDDGVFSWAVSG